MKTADAVHRFERTFARCYQLKTIGGLLNWDMNTMMPSGALSQRGEQTTFIESELHEAQVAPEYLEALETLASSKDATPVQRSAAAWQLKRSLRKARVPARLVEEMAAHHIVAQPVWVKARAEKNFSHFLPTLEKSIKLARELGAAVKEPGQTDYEGLVGEFEPGAPLAEIERLFAGLRKDLVPALGRILAKKRVKGTANVSFPLQVDKQVELNKKLIELCGFDFQHGRLDVSVHPFCGGAGSDVRLTSRYAPDDFTSSLYGALHEAGHGMYEQGMDRLSRHRALREAPGLGFHESQSRFWENHVGRSGPMVDLIHSEYARLAGPPGDSGARSRDELYDYVNRVQPSYIRVEADEATYNLHVLLRFELEAAMFSGALPAREIPGAWWEKAREYLGIEKKDDSQGCLQDIHWSIGLMGYFPTYTLGNLIAAQVDARMRKELDFSALVRERRLYELRDWMGREIHSRGCELGTLELAERATGRKLSHESFVKYLEDKHS